MATPITYVHRDNVIYNGYSEDKVEKGVDEDQPGRLSLWALNYAYILGLVNLSSYQIEMP